MAGTLLTNHGVIHLFTTVPRFGIHDQVIYCGSDKQICLFEINGFRKGASKGACSSKVILDLVLRMLQIW